MSADTAWSHHAPKVLTEADAAADLAGLPRAVSSEDALRLADGLDPNKPTFINWVEVANAANVLRTLVSERDDLAGRVAELEAERDAARKLLKNAAGCLDMAIRLEQDNFDEPPTPATAWDYNANQLVCEINAALSATTPESKP